MKSISFIHGADIHLDSPMLGLRSLPANIFQRLQESTFKAFKRLVDAAILHQVDFVILAGDLFDLEDRSIRAQIIQRKEFERLAKEEIEVFIVHGNHDHLSGQINGIHYPKNVHIFDSNVAVKRIETKDDVIVHLYGFSYPKRHVFERKIDDYHLLTGADYHIGILHGNMEGVHEHGNYAPFHIEDLLAKNFNYWALGHIHKRTLLHKEPPILYPGNTQGRNRKETGSKGCYLVNLQDTDSKLEFIETSDVIWLDLTIDVFTCTTHDALYQACTAELEKIRREDKGILVNLTLKNIRENEFESFDLEELLEMIREEERDSMAFVWPISLEGEQKLWWNRKELTVDSDFYGELFKTMDDMNDLEEVLSPLYKHPGAKKHLLKLSDAEVEVIKKEAEILLIERLIRNR